MPMFDARADNLNQYIDRIANDIGATSAILKERSENHNNGWFDTRADDRFWFAYGQLYAYYGLMKAPRPISRTCSRKSICGNLWDTMDAAIRLGAEHPALHHRQWPRGWLDHADPPDDDGLLHPARAL